MSDPKDRDVRSDAERWISAQLLARLAFFEPELWKRQGISEPVLARAIQWVFEFRDESPTWAMELTFHVWMQLDAVNPLAYALATDGMRVLGETTTRDLVRLRLGDESSD
jgi:ferric-dicitrate binding protein FerR (iron transport regulator)